MIVSGDLLYPTPIECAGLLVVGDPHVSSKKPGRRTDKDWPEPILRKLEACSRIANERNLLTVFTGDLFDDPVETDEALKTRLIRILRSFPLVVVTNVGNHDIGNATLSDGDSLAMLGASDVIDVIATSGPVCEVLIDGKRLGIGMTPYGQKIPNDVSALFPHASTTIWFTHHDIAFEKSYPGALQPHEILGCRLVINGHMHATKNAEQAGITKWINPGNINRQSIDLIDHIPKAWVIAGDGRMESITLPHEKAVFDLTGKLVDAMHDDDLVREVESAFVTLLQAETSTEMEATSDGSIIAEEMEAKFQRDKTPDRLQGTLRSLLAEAVQRRAAA